MTLLFKSFKLLSYGFKKQKPIEPQSCDWWSTATSSTSRGSGDKSNK